MLPIPAAQPPSWSLIVKAGLIFYFTLLNCKTNVKLILCEMLMQQKVRRVVISCPPSVGRQWQEEMESRFGLTFVIFDREFVASRPQERGYAIDPWCRATNYMTTSTNCLSKTLIN